MPEIPEKLKWYQPLKRWCTISNAPLPWRIVVDEMAGTVEIKRTPLFCIYWFIAGLIVAGMFAGPVYYFSGQPCAECGNQHADTFVLVLVGKVLPLAMIFFMPAIGALGIYEDSTHWNGPLRFRLTLPSGELFFAKEKVTYRKDDYSQIVIGCVQGFDTSKSELDQSIQIFMLVLDRNENWRRFLLSDDYVPWSRGSKRFKEVVEKLQPYLAFEQFVKDYSKDECLEQQNGNRAVL